MSGAGTTSDALGAFGAAPTVSADFRSAVGALDALLADLRMAEPRPIKADALERMIDDLRNAVKPFLWEGPVYYAVPPFYYLENVMQIAQDGGLMMSPRRVALECMWTGLAIDLGEFEASDHEAAAAARARRALVPFIQQMVHVVRCEYPALGGARW